MRSILKSKTWVVIGVILIIISLLIPIVTFFIGLELEVREDDAYSAYESGEIDQEEYAKKLRDISNEVYLVNSFLIWHYIFLPLGTLFAIFGLYTSLNDMKTELVQKGVIDKDFKNLYEQFKYAYSKLPERKKLEKTEKLKKLKR